MSDLVKMGVARQRLGISDSTLRRWLRSHRIRGVKLGRQWFVFDEEIQRVKAEGLDLEVKR